MRVNEFGQPIGSPVPDWQPCLWPPRTELVGNYCRLEPTHPNHTSELFTAFTQAHDANWTYMGYGPFRDLATFTDWLSNTTQGNDPQFYTIFDDSKRAVGVASYLRIEPKFGSIEVGHIHFSPRLQKKTAATEAMYLMMQRAFDELGYRRYEWKCDALNAPSRRAAKRFGFTFEGVFRQHLMYKGRNRDTAWFSIVDSEWPPIKEAFQAWLDPANFDAEGKQRKPLLMPTNNK